MKVPLLLAALGLPALALAQSAPFAPHGYLGAGVSVFNDDPANSFFSSATSFFSRYTTSVGPVLTAGWQFSPRVAVQLSPAAHWGGRTENHPGYQAVSGQSPTTIDDRIRLSRLAVPLLLRVTFTSPAARFRVDGLAGAAWLYSTFSHAYSETANATGIVRDQYSFSSSGSSTLLTLGPALRYGLGPRLELALTLPLHYELQTREYGDLYIATFSDHLRFQPQLSAYYTLGSR